MQISPFCNGREDAATEAHLSSKHCMTTAPYFDRLSEIFLQTGAGDAQCVRKIFEQIDRSPHTRDSMKAVESLGFTRDNLLEQLDCATHGARRTARLRDSLVRQRRNDARAISRAREVIERYNDPVTFWTWGTSGLAAVSQALAKVETKIAATGPMSGYLRLIDTRTYRYAMFVLEIRVRTGRAPYWKHLPPLVEAGHRVHGDATHVTADALRSAETGVRVKHPGAVLRHV
jgi:hypothetical protein